MSSSTADERSHATSTVVALNLQRVRQRMQETIKECGRSEDSVRLVAVSKTKPVEMLVQAYEVRVDE